MSRHRRNPVAVMVALAAIAIATISGCSSDPPVAQNAPPPAAAEPRTVFVALGGDETLNRGLADGFRTSWTRKVFSALPHAAVYVNLANEDATVAGAKTAQADRAIQLQATVATVWFGSGDQRVNTSDAAFTNDLTSIVVRLRDSGVRVLLLGNANDRAGPRVATLVQKVATDTGVTYVAVPGPNGNPGDLAVQDAVGTAVLARIDH